MLRYAILGSNSKDLNSAVRNTEFSGNAGSCTSNVTFTSPEIRVFAYFGYFFDKKPCW